MPRYVFNVRSSHRHDYDDEGGLFTSVDAAHITAIMTARDIAARDRLKGQFDDQKRIEVCDEAGSCVATVWLTSVADL